MIKKIICKIFNHFMKFDTSDVSGPSTCKLCRYKKKGIEWPRV